MEKTKERNKKMGSSAYFVHHMLYSRHHPPTCDSLQRAACTGAESVKMLASLDTPFGLLAKQFNDGEAEINQRLLVRVSFSTSMSISAKIKCRG